jgi:hypothetical protein
MRRVGFGLPGLVVGTPVAAFVGYWAIQLLSGNHFDRDFEASMTAMFVIGPVGAVIGVVVGVVGGPK